MQSVAQAWLVLKISNSGAALGIVSALQYIPVLFFGMYGGIAADRFSKRTILFVTQSSAGMLALILGVLVATNQVQLWMVYILAFCLGWVNVFDNPARQTFVIEMVGKDNLRNAVTLYSGLVNLSRVVGPAIAAGLIAVIGLAPCFIVNGLSYGAVVIMLGRMNTAELQVTPALTNSKGQLQEGIRYVLSLPLVRDTLLMMALVGTFTFEFQVSLPIIAHYAFNGDASSYAFLSGSLGIGAVIGGLAIAGQKSIKPFMLIIAGFLFGLAVLTAAFMPNLILSGLALVIAGACSIYFTSLGNSIVQLGSSPQMRGRVMSFWSIAFLGTTTIGGPAVGWFAEALGPRWGLALGGFAALAAGMVGLINLRHIQFIDNQSEQT